MSEPGELEDLRRILIALDASPASLAALEMAAELAARHQAELIGIYVEDVNLLRSADIPISSEVGLYSAISRRIDKRQIESELRAQAKRVEEMLSKIARRTNLRWSFRSVRGLIPRELIDAAREADLIILGKKGWSAGVQIGSTARQLAALAPVRSLILERSIRPETPILIVYDGSDESQKALKTASRMLLPGSALTILIPAPDQRSAEQLYRELEHWIGEQNFKVHFRWVPDLDSQRISHLAMVTGCEIVILPADSPLLHPEEISGLLESAHYAVLLVR
jgi:nucleotide-binding universal stress UspA family protein